MIADEVTPTNSEIKKIDSFLSVMQTGDFWKTLNKDFKRFFHRRSPKPPNTGLDKDTL
jgi:hypothetical protein